MFGRKAIADRDDIGGNGRGQTQGLVMGVLDAANGIAAAMDEDDRRQRCARLRPIDPDAAFAAARRKGDILEGDALAGFDGVFQRQLRPTPAAHVRKTLFRPGGNLVINDPLALKLDQRGNFGMKWHFGLRRVGLFEKIMDQCKQ